MMTTHNSPRRDPGQEILCEEDNEWKTMHLVLKDRPVIKTLCREWYSSGRQCSHFKWSCDQGLVWDGRRRTILSSHGGSRAWTRYTVWDVERYTSKVHTRRRFQKQIVITNTGRGELWVLKNIYTCIYLKIKTENGY